MVPTRIRTVDLTGLQVSWVSTNRAAGDVGVNFGV